MPRPPTRIALLTACLVPLFSNVVESSEPEHPPPLMNATLAPALAAAAERENIRLYQLDSLADERGPMDAIVIWIGTTRAAERKQWLVRMQRGQASPEELAANRPKDITRHLPWGSKVKFESEADAIDLWIAGPVDVNASGSTAAASSSVPPTRRTRVYLPKSILQLGLDDTVRAQRFIHRRVEEIKREDPAFNADHVFAMHKPVSPGTVTWAKPRAERMGMTPEIERTWVGGWVALQVFYECLNDQADLRNMVEIAFDKPPVWRLAKMAFGAVFHMGIDGVNSKALDPARAGLPPVTLECFEAPFLFSFDKRTISRGVLVVTKPTPPLDLSAGILGGIAVHPKDRTRMVQASLISVTRGSSSSLPSRAAD